MWCEWQKLVTTSWIKIISLLLRCRLLITENALFAPKPWMFASHSLSFQLIAILDSSFARLAGRARTFQCNTVFLLVKTKNSLNSIYVCSAHSSDEKMWCPKAVHLLQVPTYLISFGLSIGNEYTHRIVSHRLVSCILLAMQSHGNCYHIKPFVA